MLSNYYKTSDFIHFLKRQTSKYNIAT